MKHILATTLTLVAALVALQPTKSKADFTIYPTSTVMATNTGTGCPGSYIAYAVYIKSAPTFGWNPDTNNFTLFTATSTGANTNVVVQFSGKKLDSGCNSNSVIIPNPPYSTAYRFAVYFKSGTVSTNNPLTLHGFLP